MHRQRSLLSDCARSARETPIRPARDAIETSKRLLLDRRHCPNDHARRPSISPRPRRPASIPIERVAPPAPTSRDFVPWRFSDADRQRVGRAQYLGVRETCTGTDMAVAEHLYPPCTSSRSVQRSQSSTAFLRQHLLRLKEEQCKDRSAHRLGVAAQHCWQLGVHPSGTVGFVPILNHQDAKRVIEPC